MKVGQHPAAGHVHLQEEPDSQRDTSSQGLKLESSPGLSPPEGKCWVRARVGEHSLIPRWPTKTSARERPCSAADHCAEANMTLGGTR